MSVPLTDPPAPDANPPFADCLSPELYAELRRLASLRMAGQPSGTTLQPTLLVHEAWLRLAGKDDHWNDRGHFLATATTTMRHILIDHARRKARQRHGGGQARAEDAEINNIAAPAPDERLLLIDEGVRALEKTNPQRAQVVVARFFGGMTNQEIAASLGIGERSVERHWAAAKVWLLRWMQHTQTP